MLIAMPQLLMQKCINKDRGLRMKIVVCFKGVPAARHVALDPVTHNLQRDNTAMEMDPDDRYALALALQLRQQLHDVEIIALTMGAMHSQIILQAALAMGANQTILLSDRRFAGADTLATGYTLAQAINKIGDVSLVITGYTSHDADTGQVGPNLAAQLHWQQAARVSALSYDNLAWQITRRFNNNMQTLQTQDNLVVTVDREQQLSPAQMTVSGIQQAVNETVTVWNADDLQCNLQRIGTAGSATKVVSLAAPELPAQHAQQLTSATAFLNILQQGRL